MTFESLNERCTQNNALNITGDWQDTKKNFKKNKIIIRDACIKLTPSSTSITQNKKIACRIIVISNVASAQFPESYRTTNQQQFKTPQSRF